MCRDVYYFMSCQVCRRFQRPWPASPGASHSLTIGPGALFNLSPGTPVLFHNAVGAWVLSLVTAVVAYRPWFVHGSPGWAADLHCPCGYVWQSVDYLLSWSCVVGWPPILSSDLCHPVSCSSNRLVVEAGSIPRAVLLSWLGTMGWICLVVLSVPASLSCWDKVWIS